MPRLAPRSRVPFVVLLTLALGALGPASGCADAPTTGPTYATATGALTAADKAAKAEAKAEAKAAKAEAKAEAKAAKAKAKGGCDGPEDEPCPKGCSSNGVCSYGKCFCAAGWSGDGCDVPDEKPCPKGCSANGVCSYGKCFCAAGWSGDGCDVPDEKPCPKGCSANGVCSYGKCFCAAGWSGDSCDVPDEKPCPKGCSANGVCSYGKCFCAAGWSGESCDVPDDDGEEIAWTALTLEGGWFADDDAPAGAWSGLRNGDICVLSGTVRGGKDAYIGTLPEDCRPQSGRVLFASSRDGHATRVDVMPDGSLFRMTPPDGADDPLSDAAAVALDGLWIDLDTAGDEPLALAGDAWPADDTAPPTVRVGDGECGLNGTIALGDAAAESGDLAKLPEACRPDGQITFSLRKDGTPTRIDVLPDGRVLYRTDGGGKGGGWLSLDGIVWSRAGLDDEPLELAGGWAADDGADLGATFAYRTPRGNRVGGLCVLSGLARRSGDKGSLVAKLPESCRPQSGRLVFRNAVAPGETAVLDALTGELTLEAADGGPGSGWLSLDGIAFVAK